MTWSFAAFAAHALLVWYVGVTLCTNTLYRWASDHNKSVRQSIVQEILSQPDGKFSESEIKGTLYCVIHSITITINSCNQEMLREYSSHISGRAVWQRRVCGAAVQATQVPVMPRKGKACMTHSMHITLFRCLHTHIESIEVPKVYISGDKGENGEVLALAESRIRHWGVGWPQ